MAQQQQQQLHQHAMNSQQLSQGPGGMVMVKAETSEGPQQQHMPQSARPPGNGSGLFAGIASSNKRPRTDDWLAPESPQGPLPQQHIYMGPQHQAHQQQPQTQQQQQQQQQNQQQQPPLAHSTPITQSGQQQQSVMGSQQQQQPTGTNGYASPMSSGSYDPYSPNGKIEPERNGVEEARCRGRGLSTTRAEPTWPRGPPGSSDRAHQLVNAARPAQPRANPKEPIPRYGARVIVARIASQCSAERRRKSLQQQSHPRTRARDRDPVAALAGRLRGQGQGRPSGAECTELCRERERESGAVLALNDGIRVNGFGSSLELLSAAASVELAKGGARLALGPGGAGASSAGPLPPGAHLAQQHLHHHQHQLFLLPQQHHQQQVAMLAQPRLPVAGVKRRWASRPTASSSALQPSPAHGESEVSSSGMLSPPPPALPLLAHRQPAAAAQQQRYHNTQQHSPDSVMQQQEGSPGNGAQLWDLDLHGRQQQQQQQGSQATEMTLTTVCSSSSGSSASTTSNGHHQLDASPGQLHQQQQQQLTPNSVVGEGRDDLSPPSSLNGYSADSCDAKKKKGPTPRQQEELCLVCGDRASGYHYNALTCEGCKGFFRRSITKNAVYQCKYGNNCEIDMYMRRKCQECRLKKCLHVGMRPECVVPEFQCAVKRKEKKAQKEKDKPNSATMNGSTGGIGTPEPAVGVKLEPADVDPYSMSGGSGMNYVSPEQEELINRLVYFQDEYEQPNEEDLKRITNQSTENEDPSDVRFRHITEITILTVQLIVEFAKRLPGFDKLKYEDKIVLLKACSSEVMILRMARKYDYQTDSIIFANNQPYSRDSYSLAGIGDIIDDLLRFGRFMYSMKVNNAEYALLTAIVVFSERPNVSEGWKVEKIQEIYLDALKAYVEGRWKPKASAKFAKLLSVLTELRTLGNQNSETCSNLKLKNKKLPPFLAEIWDVAS